MEYIYIKINHSHDKLSLETPADIVRVARFLITNNANYGSCKQYTLPLTSNIITVSYTFNATHFTRECVFFNQT